MSLKVFHVIFLIAAIALGVLCAMWSFGSQQPPVVGYCSVVAIVGLLAYGVYFIRKARKIIT